VDHAQSVDCPTVSSFLRTLVERISKNVLGLLRRRGHVTTRGELRIESHTPTSKDLRVPIGRGNAVALKEFHGNVLVHIEMSDLLLLLLLLLRSNGRRQHTAQAGLEAATTTLGGGQGKHDGSVLLLMVM
jgi:hypothetical protein